MIRNPELQEAVEKAASAFYNKTDVSWADDGWQELCESYQEELKNIILSHVSPVVGNLERTISSVEGQRDLARGEVTKWKQMTEELAGFLTKHGLDTYYDEVRKSLTKLHQMKGGQYARNDKGA